MGNTLLNMAKGWRRGEKTGCCLCVFFLGFQEKATGQIRSRTQEKGILM